MKKRNKPAGFAAIILSVLLILLGGCSGTKTETPTSTPAPASTPTAAASIAAPANTEITKLTGYMMIASTSQTNIEKATWYTSELKEKLGIELAFKESAGVCADQIMQTMMASGDLPDIIGFGGSNGPTFANNASEAGMLLNLDDYQDKLPDIYGEDIYRNAIAYSRDYLSGGKNNLYLMPLLIGVDDYRCNYDIQMRWDLYQQMGQPQVVTFEDYLEVGKQMQELYPTTPDGQKVYAFSIFPEWDGDGILMAWEGTLVWSRSNIKGYIEVDVSGKDLNSTKNTFDDDAGYLRILKFFYQANQMGLLDPDSMTQQYDNLKAKYDEGRVLWSLWSWAVTGFNVSENTNANPPMGYASIWFDEMVAPIAADAPAGRLESIGISNKTKNLDAALRFINYFYSYEGVDFIINGPQGELWDINDKGVRYRTEKGFDAYVNDVQGTFMDGGGLRSDASAIFGYLPLSAPTLNPYTGQTVSNTYWDDVLTYKPTALVAQWREAHGGIRNMLEVARSQNRTSKTSAAVDMMNTVPDNIDTLINQISDVVQVNSWKMIYASNDAEFNTLWDDLKNKTKGLGIETAQEWARQAWEENLAKEKKYKQ